MNVKNSFRLILISMMVIFAFSDELALKPSSAKDNDPYLDFLVARQISELYSEFARTKNKDAAFKVAVYCAFVFWKNRSEYNENLSGSYKTIVLQYYKENKKYNNKKVNSVLHEIRKGYLDESGRLLQGFEKHDFPVAIEIITHEEKYVQEIDSFVKWVND